MPTILRPRRPRSPCYHLDDVACLLIAVACCGCSNRPAAIAQVEVDPVAVASSLLESYDGDGDDALSADETQGFGCVEKYFGSYDVNNDGRLDREELSGRIGDVVFNPHKRFMSGECVVKRKGRPLTNATVHLKPLACLSGVIPPAAGVTNPAGFARLRLDEKDLPAGAPPFPGLVRPGLYRVEVTHASIPVPARFNSQSVLTAEISSASLNEGPILVDLDF